MNRKILASVLVIGVVAAVAGGSTFALFNDTETSSGNTFTAGELDLQIDWNESYNGEHIEEQPLTDNPGPIFSIEDVKPGDYGEATVSLHVEDNPAYVSMNLTQTANLENGCSEPESDVDDTCGSPGSGEGELGDNLYFTVWNDDGDNIRQDDEEVYFNGTAEELDAIRTLQLDGDADTEGIQPFDPSTTEYVGISWNVPKNVGNEIQTDSKKFNFTYYAEQSRHNEPGNMTDPEEEPPMDNETPDNETEPPVEPPEDNDTDDNVTEPPVDNNDTDNETEPPVNGEDRAAISFASFCVENGDDNGTNGSEQTANQPCPDDESQLVKFEWNGNSFSPEGGDAMGISINATEFKDNDTSEPVEADWTSEQEISTAVVKSAQDICNFTGGTNGTVESCGPPPGQQ